jgi:formylglycine-generating enzyme required for sulfatase activity
MGTNEGPSDSQPAFSLHLDAFYMDVLEVTIGDFEKYRQDQKENKKPLPPTTNPTASPGTPVLGVPWGMANAYARWLKMELPTEAEFEKAARGPHSLRTPWGDGRAVWSVPRTPETLTVTGAFANDRSPYGIYDLAGNAREWCSDLYSENAHRDAVASSSQTPRNWQGPKKVPNTNLRVVKGNGADWSAWIRQGREIGKGHSDVGFRCVLRVTVPESNG